MYRGLTQPVQKFSKSDVSCKVGASTIQFYFASGVNCVQVASAGAKLVFFRRLSARNFQQQCPWNVQNNAVCGNRDYCDVKDKAFEHPSAFFVPYSLNIALHLAIRPYSKQLPMRPQIPPLLHRMSNHGLWIITKSATALQEVSAFSDPLSALRERSASSGTKSTSPRCNFGTLHPAYRQRSYRQRGVSEAGSHKK
ncbi:hypothetical protein QR680_012907 [Steinernema hermaphroditum]|uniref:Uncharacterized protein n=1 Tax=Steinernema hermaphroditum TaxID=289476 RepID=A0AA39I614_9BILA|nr:hypothetical protein QR680_012907 [Steinernema hermaphroditum]